MYFRFVCVKLTRLAHVCVPHVPIHCPLTWHCDDYDYYDQDKFLKDLKKITSTKLLHLNARSLQKNISNIIIDLINLLGNNISVIGITESWLKHTKDPQGLLN